VIGQGSAGRSESRDVFQEDVGISSAAMALKPSETRYTWDYFMNIQAQL